MGDAFRRDGIDDHDLHKFMLSRSACTKGWGRCPGAAAPAGGLPPWTTLNRIPRGHSGPPRDRGFRLRESPQKIRVQGGRPPADTTAPERLPLRHEESERRPPL